MDAHTLRDYRERWLAVNEMEATERRIASVAARWVQMNAILSLAMGLNIPLESNTDSDGIQERWMKLRGSIA